MKIKQSLRIKILNKIAQQTVQPATVITGTNKPLNTNINAYFPVIQKFPNFNINLFDNIDWPYLSKIVGTIDHLLSGVSFNKMNFYSVAITNQSVNTSQYPNSQGLTSLIQLTHYLYKTMAVPGTQAYTAEVKKQLLNNLSTMINNSNITSFPSSALKELGNPRETLFNTITAWTAVIK